MARPSSYVWRHHVQILPGQIASPASVDGDRAARPFIASRGGGNLRLRGQLRRIESRGRPCSLRLRRGDLSLVLIAQGQRQSRPGADVVKQTSNARQLPLGIQPELRKAGVRPHIRAEQTQIEAPFPSSAIDLRIGHADSSFGLLHVGPNRRRGRVWLQRQVHFSDHELFERVAQLERSVGPHAEEAFQLDHGSIHLPGLQESLGLEPAQLDFHHVAFERWGAALIDSRAQQLRLARRRRRPGRR